jgi:hypothetical protein
LEELRKSTPVLPRLNIRDVIDPDPTLAAPKMTGETLPSDDLHQYDSPSPERSEISVHLGMRRSRAGAHEMTTKPYPPSPHNERAFIEWLLRYGRDFEPVRMIYASNLDRAVQLFANQADKELREYNSHETLRARSDYIHRLFAEGFFPAVSNDIRNILFLEPTRQAEYMQIFVKMALLDYILLYKYKDNLLVAKETVEGLGFEKLYDPNQGEQSAQVTEDSREHKRIHFSPSLPDVTKTKPIKAQH